MGKFRRLAGIVLSAAMLAAAFTACGGNQAEQTTTAEKEASQADTTLSQQVKSEPVEINVFDVGGSSLAFGQDDAIWQDNPMAQKILEAVNVKIKFEFPTGDGKEKLNLLLAGGDYPEIILGPDDTSMNKMITEKIAVPLEPLIDKEGANIKQAYGKVLELLRMSDGHIYNLTTGYGEIPEGVNPPGYGSCFSIRKDVYEGIGSPKVETTDDIYAVLKQLASKYTKNDKGDKVWPMSGFKQTWQNTMQTLLDAGGLAADYWYIDNSKLQYWVRAPYALNIVKFYNKIYREGLLDPESFTQDRDTWMKNKVQTARTLTHLGGWWMNWTVENDYKAAGMANAENMGFIDLAFSVPGGQTPKLNPVNRKGNTSAVITTNCKDPDAAMRLLDFLASPEGNFQVQNGVQGIMWDLQDGKPVMKPEYVARWKAGEADEKFCAETGLRMYHHFTNTDVGRSQYGSYWILKDDPTVMDDAKARARDEQLGKYWYDTFPVSNLFAQAPDDITNINTLVDDRFNNQLYAVIMAKSEADCQTEFDKYVKDLDTAGLAKMEEYANQVYQANIKLLGN